MLLWTRKEKEIAIVSHNRFLSHTLSVLSADWHPSMKTEICSDNLIGFNYSSSTTNYPGKIPRGLVLLSDVADLI
ncbi:hypothetical protein PanWU01x14_158460 [Parasponia andersonii]|uniref:Histidine phosphatase superfamily n=1 Tax=Parasponia andersonii TaxID=3476 RepID=A0A2P5CF60_PARAD|nr:hypothetical protein PanWU01x14_158460 [Parasponia andersonii]